MFLSTVIPSTMLNATKSLNMSPYNFSLPYNFTRGRNIIINVNPIVGDINGSSSLNALVNRSYVGITPDILNRKNIMIPNNIVEHITNMDIVSRAYTNGVVLWLKYTVEIKCDLTNNMITFTPLTLTSIVGNATIADDWSTMPTLITISTVI